MLTRAEQENRILSLGLPNQPAKILCKHTDSMDIAVIPGISSVVLTGLDYSMKPEHVRFEISRGMIKPFHDLKVMHLIKSLA